MFSLARLREHSYDPKSRLPRANTTSHARYVMRTRRRRETINIFIYKALKIPVTDSLSLRSGRLLT